MDKWLRILRSPEGDEGGGAIDTGGDGGETGAPPLETPPPAVVDASTMVKMADGTEVSVADLQSGYAQRGEAVQERDALATRMEGVMSLFNDNTAPEERENVTRQILSDAGYGQEEVDAYIDVVGMNSNTEYEDDDVSGEQVSEYTEQPAADNSRVEALERELASMRQGQHQSRVRELEDNLNRNLDRVLDSHPKLKVLFDKTQSLQPTNADGKTTKEAVARARKAVKGQLKREALEKLNVRRTQAGTFDDSWMSEEIEKAVEPVLGIYQSVIGDIDRLGRTPETVTGSNVGQEILSRDPVPKPDFKVGTDNAARLKAWTEDSLVRMAASSAGDTKV